MNWDLAWGLAWAAAPVMWMTIASVAFLAVLKSRIKQTPLDAKGVKEAAEALTISTTIMAGVILAANSVVFDLDPNAPKSLLLFASLMNWEVVWGTPLVAISMWAATSAWIQVSMLSSSQARTALELLSLLVPTRIASEDIGDAIEVISRLERTGKPPWQMCLKVASTVFWVGVSTLHELTASGKSKAPTN